MNTPSTPARHRRAHQYRTQNNGTDQRLTGLEKLVPDDGQVRRKPVPGREDPADAVRGAEGRAPKIEVAQVEREAGLVKGQLDRGP